MIGTQITNALLAREHAAASLEHLDKAIRELNRLSYSTGGAPVLGQFEAHAVRDKLAMVAELTHQLVEAARRIELRTPPDTHKE
jgi:hypothetical protein